MGNKRENDFYTISRENYLIATYLLQKNLLTKVKYFSAGF